MLKAIIGLAALAAGAAPGWASWQKAESAHFIIYADARPAELREFASKLERFDQAVRLVRAMEDHKLTDSEKLSIYVLPDREAVAKLAGSDSVAGFYRPSATGSVAFVPRVTGSESDPTDLNAFTIFFHEYAHHLQLQTTQIALPAWFVEGSAEFLSTARIRNDGSVEIGRPPQHRAYGLYNTTGLDIEQMVGGTYTKLTSNERDLLYGRGWLLTHYLMFEPKRAGQWVRYLAGIQKGMPALESARAAFGDLKALDRELGRYMRGTFTAMRVPGDKLNPGAIALRPMSAGEAAIMKARIRSKRGVNAETAPEVAAEARKAAQGFPNDPFVQGTLAEAEHDAKNYPAALAAAERALAADPNAVHALIYKGRVLVEMAKADRSKADWEAIRGWFIKANRLDTENAEPLLLYYKSFLDAGQRPTADAVKGLEYALALVPQDRELRLNLMRQYLRDSRIDRAKLVFGPIAFDPHASESWKTTAAGVLAAIAARDSKAALALLDAELQRRPAPAPQRR